MLTLCGTLQNAWKDLKASCLRIANLGQVAQTLAHGPNPACRAVTLSPQGSPQVRKLGSREQCKLQAAGSSLTCAVGRAGSTPMFSDWAGLLPSPLLTCLDQGQNAPPHPGPCTHLDWGHCLCSHYHVNPDQGHPVLPSLHKSGSGPGCFPPPLMYSDQGHSALLPSGLRPLHLTSSPPTHLDWSHSALPLADKWRSGCITPCSQTWHCLFGPQGKKGLGITGLGEVLGRMHTELELGAQVLDTDFCPWELDRSSQHTKVGHQITWPNPRLRPQDPEITLRLICLGNVGTVHCPQVDICAVGYQFYNW